MCPEDGDECRKASREGILHSNWGYLVCTAQMSSLRRLSEFKQHLGTDIGLSFSLFSLEQSWIWWYLISLYAMKTNISAKHFHNLIVKLTKRKLVKTRRVQPICFQNHLTFVKITNNSQKYLGKCQIFMSKIMEKLRLCKLTNVSFFFFRWESGLLNSVARTTKQIFEKYLKLSNDRGKN